MIYASFTDGVISGFWDTDLFPDDGDNRNSSIPLDAIEVSKADQQKLVEYPQDWRLVDGELVEYERPPLTIEEIRAGMPKLTSRQFWMAAANIDIDKDVIVTAIKANMPDSVDRKMMIAELEASTFERNNISVSDIMALLDIPAEQVDDLWIWAATL